MFNELLNSGHKPESKSPFKGMQCRPVAQVDAAHF